MSAADVPGKGGQKESEYHCVRFPSLGTKGSFFLYGQ